MPILKPERKRWQSADTGGSDWNYAGKYILLVEGSVPSSDGGVYCMIVGRTAEDILQAAAKDAAALIAWGSCASKGCIQSSNPNPTVATPIHKLISNTVINVPGCPPVADVMTGGNAYSRAGSRTGTG